jgi:hypothetical protein
MDLVHGLNEINMGGNTEKRETEDLARGEVM